MSTRYRVLLFSLLLVSLAVISPVSAAPRQIIPPHQQPTPFNGQIDDHTSSATFPITGVTEGSSIHVEVQATGGDLNTVIYLIFGTEIKRENVVASNDDVSPGNTNSALDYPNAKAGDYIILVTQYGGTSGKTSGTYSGSVTISPPSTSPQITANPLASGYPADSPKPVADWTILAYVGGDNNLEKFAINDLNEFELAGGSTPSVRIVALLDRSPANDTSNGDWSGTRIFEMGPNVTGDTGINTATLDTPALADLGNLDTADPTTLANFLVWGITNYPAKHYAIELNDHGGAWSGLVTDDTAGAGSILDIPGYEQAFSTALQTAGLDKFDLLLTDACLMSSADYLGAMDQYFHFSINSPEIQMTPAWDLTLLTNLLNQNPNVNIGDLGKAIVDKYMTDMVANGFSNLPYLTGSVVNMDNFGAVTDAIANFASLVEVAPALYAPLIGDVRANSYVYSPFEPEEQGPHDKIDLGDFMNRIIASSSSSPDLKAAAQAVDDAMKSALIYGTAGDTASKVISYFNIYFPASGSIFDSNYLDQSPLTDWAAMLRDYYANAGSQGAASAASGDQLNLPAPTVNITNVYPAETSIYTPTVVSMEVSGKQISQGDFTVDYLLGDGSAIRLETSRIVTSVETSPGVIDYINQWTPGVDSSNFTWPVTVETLTDGQSTNYEWITFSEQGVASVAGRYHDPGSETWHDVYIIFDDNGHSSQVMSSENGVVGNIQLQPGSEFQTYGAIVTPDGQVSLQPGNSYQWTDSGLNWESVPAPTGKYNLGFLVRSFNGTTGFGSTQVNVNNDNVDSSYAGYTDIDWGINFAHPADWSSVEFYQSSAYLLTANNDFSQMMAVYPADVSDASDPNLLQTIAQDALSPQNVTVAGPFTPITVGGLDAVQFDYAYSTDQGDYQGRGFAVYIDNLQLGLVFGAETLNGDNLDTDYQLLLDSTGFFDATAVKAQDKGQWGTDSISPETVYPVRLDWLNGVAVDIWKQYSPGADPQSQTFIRFTQMPGTDAQSVLNDVMSRYAPTNAPGYEVRASGAYAGGGNIWQQALYVYADAAGQTIVGIVNVTYKNGTAYVVWYETVNTSFTDLYNGVFTPMMDGLQISTPAQ